MDKYLEKVVQFKVEDLISNKLMDGRILESNDTVFIDTHTTSELQKKIEKMKDNDQLEFLPRHMLENNPIYRHLVCYVIIRDVNTKEVLYYGRTNPSEERLDNKMSLGWGGHIRKDDFYDYDKEEYYMDNVHTFLERELHEELSFEKDSITSIDPKVYLLYHDMDEVGSVHIGIVYIINVVNILENVKSLEDENIILGQEKLVDLKKLHNFDNFELWSKQIIDQRKKFE